MSTTPITKTYTIKDFQALAYFVITLLGLGIIWGQNSSRIDDLARTQTQQGEQIKIINMAAADNRERTVRLETQYSTIIDSLSDIKQSIKDQKNDK